MAALETAREVRPTVGASRREAPLDRALRDAGGSADDEDPVHRTVRTRRSVTADGAHAPRTCATLLVDLAVHPRVIMRVLRHADQAVTMEIDAKASSDRTRDALRRLGGPPD